jgi:hypothetical protein
MVPRWCWMVEMASIRKIRNTWVFEQNRSPIPCNEYTEFPPSTIHQKLTQIVQIPFGIIAYDRRMIPHSYWIVEMASIRKSEILGFSSKTDHRSHTMTALSCHQQFIQAKTKSSNAIWNHGL